MKFLWQYLIKRIEVVVDAWGRYLQGMRNSSESACDQPPKRCPFSPILPDKDSLESMVGDFFERHERLIQNDVALPIQFGLTAICFAVLVVGIFDISVDNCIDSIIGFVKSKVEVPPSDLEEE